MPHEQAWPTTCAYVISRDPHASLLEQLRELGPQRLAVWPAVNATEAVVAAAVSNGVLPADYAQDGSLREPAYRDALRDPFLERFLVFHIVPVRQ